MKKILVLTPDLKNIGGVANYYKTLSLDQADHIDYFFVNVHGKENALKKIIRLLTRYILFWKILKKVNYQLVHVNPSLDKKSFFRDALFTYLAIIAQKKILVFFRGWDEKFELSIHKSPIKKWIFLNTFGKSKYLLLLSRYFEPKVTNLAATLNASKVWFETTVADNSFLPLLDIHKKAEENPVNFLFLSRLVKEKGIFIALDAINEIQKKYPDRKIHLYVGGDGPDLNLAKKYVTQHNIENIHFLGFVSGDQKGKLLLDCHVLLFPTFHGEGLPNTVLEAMLYGMPVISRINAGIPDVVTHEKNGFITESLSYEKFAEFIDILISENQIYKKMVFENYDKAKNAYTSDVVKNRLLNIYSEILN
ncbi:glycosyltransferase family 4 protein [Chondrinema litorale]|uniref:glycosyltransferase family 4 protein n=1 Tax=Chondrinema litorale TaxID=2994555 RepID=UPI002542AABD|nr:glycosyltransferase family 4 protein [Chondrinema litorale]UZS00186.1 glycosyltransferase family 4 protein [Chondrinema litorale]